MTAPNPGVKTARADRIEQTEALLDALYAALDKKKGRGNVQIGEVNVSFSNLLQLQEMIQKYEYRLAALRRPQDMRL